MTTATADRPEIRIDRDTLRVWASANFAGTLPDLSGDEWREKADESADNNVDALYVFRLDADWQLEVYTEQGCPSVATIEPCRPIIDAICDFDTGEGDLAQLLTEWGQDPFRALRPAVEGYDGPCRVWHEPCYYGGTYNAPRPGYAELPDLRTAGIDLQEWEQVLFARCELVEFNGAKIIEFPDYAAAAEYVSHYYNDPSGYDGIPACNVLSHGQAGSDKLTIVEA